MGVVELNAAQLAYLVLVAMQVMILGDLYASSGGFVVFAPALTECVVEYFIVATRYHFLMAYASTSHQDLLQLRL